MVLYWTRCAAKVPLGTVSILVPSPVFRLAMKNQTGRGMSDLAAVGHVLALLSSAPR